eukprot:XP_001705622.1 Hypothetical protein GL50803_34518 [Giardia lamblia ATCC 50803]
MGLLTLMKEADFVFEPLNALFDLSGLVRPFDAANESAVLVKMRNNLPLVFLSRKLSELPPIHIISCIVDKGLKSIAGVLIAESLAVDLLATLLEVLKLLSQICRFTDIYKDLAINIGDLCS